MALLARSAGELLLLPWQMLVAEKGKIGKFTCFIAHYLTRSEIIKRVAGKYYTPMIYIERLRKIIRFLLKF